MSKNKQPTKAFNRKPCVIATGLALSLMAAQSVYAQTAADTTQKAEKIEVTGTRIPPPNMEGTSPVTVIDAASIKVDGGRSVETLLNNLPQVFAAQGAQVSNGASGTATVNLRGLGSQRTLVLVNGRRLPAGSANSPSADLNEIPAPLIKRVEILTGGAGAVYGSDAVAGVVNFIMNNRFEGVQVELNQSFYNHKQQNPSGIADIVAGRALTNPGNFAVPGNKSSDGKIYDANFILGSNFANGKGNATVYFGYKKEDSLLQSERDFSACSLNSAGKTATLPDRFVCGGSGTSATGRFTNTTTGKVFTIADAAGTARPFANATDQYNFGPINFFQRPSESYNVSMFGNYDILPNVNLYTEFAFHDNRTNAQIAPGGLFGTVATLSFDNPLLSQSARDAFGLQKPGDKTDVVIQRRNVEGGGRNSDIRNTSFREVVGVKGDIGNWNYDAFMQTAKVNFTSAQQNYFSSSRGALALDVVNVNGVATCRAVVNGTDPACIPYNPFKLGGVKADQLAYIAVAGYLAGGTEQTIQGANISTDLGTYGIKLPSAKNGVGVSFGIERRTEKLALNPDAPSQAGDLSGSGGPTPPVSGKYTVKEFFGEVRAPLIEGAQFAELVSVNGSYRNSDYTTGQKSDTYGLGIEWAPVKQARFRASYQQAVRAANLIELYTPQGLGLYNDTEDPCAGATPTATLAQCQRTGVTAAQYGKIQDSPAGQYNGLFGGNANLKPETAKSTTFGVVASPLTNLSFTVDYFDIKVADTISNVPQPTTLRNCLNTGDPTFCSQVQRDQLGTIWLLPQGFVKGVNVNIGAIRTSGIDLGVTYTQKFSDYGSVVFNMVGTYLQKSETEPVKGGGKFDCVGLYGQLCGTPNPEWRHKARATWTTPWNVDLSMTWRFFGKVDADTTSSNPLLAGTTRDVERTLGHRDYFDLAGSWAVSKQLTLSGGVNNLLDKDPPLAGSAQAGAPFGNGNTFPVVYDALGRRVFLNATYKF